MVSAAEIATFQGTLNFRGEEQGPPCCTPNAFKYHLLGPPHHPWNQSAARVFTRDYIHKNGLQSHVDTAQRVMKAFFTRLKALRRQYTLLNNNQQVISTQRHRRDQRKRSLPQLFDRRLEVAGLNPHLQRHARFIQRLGPAGMSSDESDHEEARHVRTVSARRPTFRVLLPEWRATAMTKWLHSFDTVFDATRRMGGPSQGCYPRIRQYNERELRWSDSKGFVKDLPRSAYREEWLNASHQDFVDLSVRPTEEVYHFTHDPELAT
ncbi:hypothetical protein FPV67DRAFT_1426916 [Lyophyllum atratum]|nr:hypothetical protein FPV67DRAFT_1426916 [Lyophyllum atratum]